MRLFVLALALGLVGCGGANWDGTYTGTQSVSGTCSDGSNVPSDSGSASFTLKEGSDDTITWTAKCGVTVTAKTNGNVATIQQVACPPTTSNGNTINVTLTGGTLTINDNSLAVALTETLQVSGPTTNGTCHASITGTLARQK